MDRVKRTDAIAGDILHVYDGIEEADNALPNWWVAVFIGTIAFGAVYYLVYQKYELEPNPGAELVALQAEQAKLTGHFSDDDILAAARNNAAVNSGKQTFMKNCVACHGANAQGNIGPNLTDAAWLHGGAPSNIFATIRDGVPAKGMPTWSTILGTVGVRDVAAYVVTVRNTNVVGKAPQGDPYTGP